MLKTIIRKKKNPEAFFFYYLIFKFIFFKLKRLTQNPKAELKRFWVGLDCGTK